jgi:predicted phage terminase large subunit-like protein
MALDKQQVQKKLSILEKMKHLQELPKLAKENYASYVEFSHGARYTLGKFQVYICDTIDKFLKGELLNEDGEPYEGMTISVPPQHGKSMCVTETLPSYYLGKNPYDHVIEISYGDDLAQKFGRRNKEKIEEVGKLFGIKISNDKNSTVDFELEGTKGGMLSKGIGAGVSGFQADMIIVDDPYKNRADADSPTYSKFVIDEFMSVVEMRASSKCKFIVIHTRWNEDDLTGWLIENQPKRWFKISFPLIAEEDEPIIDRKFGEALLPEAGKDTAWAEKKKTVFLSDPTEGGMRAWNALMQQRPSSKEGNLIKREYWQRYRLTLKMQKGEGFDELLQSWDCSFKDTKNSDLVAGGTFGRIGANCFLLDVDYRRMDIIATMQAILDMSKKWPRALCKLIEDKANGPAVITMLKVKLPGMVPVQATKSKEERVNAVLPVWESGNVFIPDEIEIKSGQFVKCMWADQVIDQCANFKPGKKVQKDDLVDMCSQSLHRLMFAFVKKNKPQNVGRAYMTTAEQKDEGYTDMEPRKTKVVNKWG